MISSILRHPNLVHFFGASTKQGSLAIIMEFISGGDLWTLIRKTSTVLGINQKLNIALQICGAMVILSLKKNKHTQI